MVENPDFEKLFDEAHIIVGCSSESAVKVYFDAETALKNVSEHEYIAFFDAKGDKIGEVKVEFSDDDDVILNRYF